MLAADGRSPKSSGRHSDDASAMTDETTSTVVPTPPLPPAPDAAPNAPARRRARPDASQAGDGGRRLRSYTSQLEACSSSAGLDASSSGAELSLAPRRIKLTFSSLSPSVEPDASACAGPAQPVRDGPAEALDTPKGKGKSPARPVSGTRQTSRVAHWHDLEPTRLWNGDLFTVLPAELLDLIISIDADLDLRDHLALSGTCRFLRRCYTDVVFEVLFEAFRGTTRLVRGRQYAPEEIVIFPLVSNSPPLGVTGSHVFASTKESSYQLVGRSWNAARHIVSSAGATGHGHYWDAWGTTTEERQVASLHRQAMQGDLRRELEHQGVTLEATSTWTLEPLLTDSSRVFEVDMTTEEANRRLMQMPEWQRVEVLRSWDEWRDQTSDPWRSTWRLLVADIVNLPLIAKTQAKAAFRVSDRELLALKSFAIEQHMPANSIRYKLAAVQALAFRAHGGPLGHAAHIAKLDARAANRRAAKIASGAIRPHESSQTAQALAAHDWEDWTEDGLI